MPAAALAIDEEGEDEEEEGEGEEEEDEDEDWDRGGHGGVQRVAMYPLTSKGHSRLKILLITIAVLACLFIAADASPLHPAPPHRGESPFIPDVSPNFACLADHSIICQFINAFHVCLVKCLESLANFH